MANQETKDIIKGMLTENTGTHFLDSGGAYGRHWQQNQSKVEQDPNYFENQPSATIDFWECERDGQIEQEIGVTINLYHWLCSRVEYSEVMQRKYEAFTKNKYRHYDEYQGVDYDMTDMEEFIEALSNKYEVTGLYGDDYRTPSVCYTYNCENNLSQDMQFIYFEADLDGCGLVPFVLLQIHNGADARGGLTSPKCFEIDDSMHGDSACWFDWQRCSICDESGNAWDSEGGWSNWSHERYVPANYHKDQASLFSDGAFDDRSVDYSKLPNLDDYTLETDDDGNPLSPIDGSVLEAYVL